MVSRSILSLWTLRLQFDGAVYHKKQDLTPKIHPARLRLAAVLAVYAFVSSPAIDAQGAATPLSVEGGVRALGLGQAYCAIAEDSQTIYFNPAGLGNLSAFQISGMGSPQKFGQTSWSMEFGIPFKEVGGFGFGTTGLQIRNITTRDLEFDLPQTASSLEGALLLGYGHKLRKNLSIGLTGKYIYHRFFGFSDHASGYALNLGLHYRPHRLNKLSLGVVGQNLLGKLLWSTGRQDSLSFVGRVGVSYNFFPWLLAAAETELGNSRIRGHGGIELRYDRLIVRGGANHNQPTAGFGIVIPLSGRKLQFDYAAALEFTELNDVHRFGLSFSF